MTFISLIGRDVAGCSGNESVASCNINYPLPSIGYPKADWVIGGLFTAFYCGICYGTYLAFHKKKTLRLPWISLLFFCGFRAAGYLMRAWVDDNPVQSTSTFQQATDWVKLLTISYSIINAGTTFFLIFLASLVIAFRRCCRVSSEHYTMDHETNARKREDHLLMFFRFFVVGVAVVNIVGSLRQFDYYWLDYNQGILMRKIAGFIQLVVAVAMIIIVLIAFVRSRFPSSCWGGAGILLQVLPIYLITLCFNIVRVFQPLESSVNQDPDYTYYLSAMPDLINLWILLVFTFDRILDYENPKHSLQRPHSSENNKNDA